MSNTLSNPAVQGKLLLAVLAFAALSCRATAKENVPVDGVLTARVSAGCDLLVQDKGLESETCWSLACESRKAVDLGCDLSALHQVAALSPSPDGRWLGVVSVGEGHPFLEVVDLESLLAGRGYKALTTINPYPGTINIQGWTDSALLVTSDMPLPELPLADGDGDIAGRMLPSQQVFALELGTWKAQAIQTPPNR
jgi:hypothetical protein